MSTQMCYTHNMNICLHNMDFHTGCFNYIYSSMREKIAFSSSWWLWIYWCQRGIFSFWPFFSWKTMSILLFCQWKILTKFFHLNFFSLIFTGKFDVHIRRYAIIPFGTLKYNFWTHEPFQCNAHDVSFKLHR